MIRITSNVQQVLREWEVNTKIALQMAQDATNKTLELLFKDIVARTPVGNPKLWRHPYHAAGYKPGKLKASWNISYGNSPRDSTTGRFRSVAGMTNYGGIVMKINGLPVTAYIYNTQEYAQVIETGWSGQAPQGMVRLAVQNFAYYLDMSVRRVRK